MSISLMDETIVGFLDRYDQPCSDHLSEPAITTALLFGICPFFDGRNIVGFLDRYGQPCSDSLSESAMTTALIFGICPFFDGRNIVGFLDRFDQPSSDYYIDLEDGPMIFHRENIASFLDRYTLSSRDHIGLEDVPFLDGEHTALSLTRSAVLALSIRIRNDDGIDFRGVCWGKPYFAHSVQKAAGGFH